MEMGKLASWLVERSDSKAEVIEIICGTEREIQGELMSTQSGSVSERRKLNCL